MLSGELFSFHRTAVESKAMLIFEVGYGTTRMFLLCNLQMVLEF